MTSGGAILLIVFYRGERVPAVLAGSRFSLLFLSVGITDTTRHRTELLVRPNSVIRPCAINTDLNQVTPPCSIEAAGAKRINGTCACLPCRADIAAIIL